MKKKKLLAASREDCELSDPTTEDSSQIVFRTGNWLDNDSEMLRISKDGFYVRGQKVLQDEREAAMVYHAFKEWLTLQSLTRKY